MSMDVMERVELDDFGNWIGFSDAVLGPMTLKGFLSKQMERVIMSVHKCCLAYYSSGWKAPDMTVGFNMRCLRDLFHDTVEQVNQLWPVISDLVSEDLTALDVTIQAVYGEDSDEWKLYCLFQRLCKTMGSWDAVSMWNDADGEPEVKSLLRLGSEG